MINIESLSGITELNDIQAEKISGGTITITCIRADGSTVATPSSTDNPSSMSINVTGDFEEFRITDTNAAANTSYAITFAHSDDLDDPGDGLINVDVPGLYRVPEAYRDGNNNPYKLSLDVVPTSPVSP